MAKVHGAFKNIKFSPGVTTKRTFGPAPENLSKRVSPVPHAKAANAKTTGAIPSFPNASQMQPGGPRKIRGSA
jgi:hypothetical protein